MPFPSSSPQNAESIPPTPPETSLPPKVQACPWANTPASDSRNQTATPPKASPPPPHPLSSQKTLIPSPRLTSHSSSRSYSSAEKLALSTLLPPPLAKRANSSPPFAPAPPPPLSSPPNTHVPLGSFSKTLPTQTHTPPTFSHGLSTRSAPPHPPHPPPTSIAGLLHPLTEVPTHSSPREVASPFSAPAPSTPHFPKSLQTNPLKSPTLPRSLSPHSHPQS